MRMKRILVFVSISAFACSMPAVADTAQSAECVFAADTLESPRSIKTAEELAGGSNGLWVVTWRAGETVTATAADGSTATFVENAPSNGSGALSALSLASGGIWTLANSRQGVATFTVRHSLFGTLGDGTAASPAKIVDADELAYLVEAGSVGEGFHFILAGANGLLASLVLPSGFSLQELPGDVWRMDAASAGGVVYACLPIGYAMDSLSSGPDRTLRRNTTIPLAYSGDNWLAGRPVSSSLSIVAPSGAETSNDFAGTGTIPFCPNETGPWSVSMASAYGTLTATIRVIRRSTFVVLR